MDRESSDRKGMTRRDFGRYGLGLALAAAAAGGATLGARRAFAQDEPYVTDVPENAPMVQALKYVSKSETPDQKCANCALFLGGTAPKGKCGLFQKGVVSAEGHCTSWSKKTA